MLADGSYQGTPGVFLRLRCDVNWADITEHNGQVRTHPVVWLAHGGRGPRFREMIPAVTDTIKAGRIWVMDGAQLPPSLLVQSQPDSNGWAAVEYDRSTFEKAVQNAGWTLFFMAGEIEATVLGFDREKALRAAFRRLIANVTSQHCNSIEITRVTRRSFLGIPYVNVSAHPRHLQKGVFFRGNGADSDRVPFPQMAESDWRVTVS